MRKINTTIDSNSITRKYHYYKLKSGTEFQKEIARIILNKKPKLTSKRRLIYLVEIINKYSFNF